MTATVTDGQGKVLYAGSVDSAPHTNGALTGWNNETDCHGNSFADGKFWINNKDVPALMKGDGYDIGNPSTTPIAGSIGIYSTDGTLRSTGPGEDDTTVRHSVTVIDPGQQGEMFPWADKTSGRDELTPSSPTTVESKAGVTPRTQTSPAAAWRQPNAVLLYYSKKVKQ